MSHGTSPTPISEIAKTMVLISDFSEVPTLPSILIRFRCLWPPHNDNRHCYHHSTGVGGPSTPVSLIHYRRVFVYSAIPLFTRVYCVFMDCNLVNITVAETVPVE